MKFRPARHSLEDAMAEVVELKDRAELVHHLAVDLHRFGYELNDADVRVSPCGFDERINWSAYIVTIRNKRCGKSWYFGEAMRPDYFGAVGFTNAPAEPGDRR